MIAVLEVDPCPEAVSMSAGLRSRVLWLIGLFLILLGARVAAKEPDVGKHEKPSDLDTEIIRNLRAENKELREKIQALEGKLKPTPPPPPPPPKFWSFELGISYSEQRGNSDVGRVGVDQEILYDDKETWEVGLEASYDWAESDGERKVHKGISTGNVDYMPYSRLSPFGFCIGYFDEARSIKWGLDGGLGAKWTILRIPYDPLEYTKKPFSKYSLSGAVLGRHETFTSYSGGGNNDELRFSLRLRADQQIYEDLFFRATAYYVPEADRIDDYEVSVKASLLFILTKYIRFKVTYRYFYDNKPPSRRKREDREIILSLAFKY
jgi:hypothetical protein